MERKADELRKELASSDSAQDDDDDMVPLENIGMMQATEEFDEMVVWSHEAVVTAAEDPYVRSVEEWLQMADQVFPKHHPDISQQIANSVYRSTLTKSTRRRPRRYNSGDPSEM